MQTHHHPPTSIPAGYANAKPSARKSHLDRPKFQRSGRSPAFAIAVATPLVLGSPCVQAQRSGGWPAVFLACHIDSSGSFLWVRSLQTETNRPGQRAGGGEDETRGCVELAGRDLGGSDSWDGGRYRDVASILCWSRSGDGDCWGAVPGRRLGYLRLHSRSTRSLLGIAFRRLPAQPSSPADLPAQGMDAMGADLFGSRRHPLLP